MVFEKYFYLSLTKNDNILLQYILNESVVTESMLQDGILHASFFGLPDMLQLLLSKSKDFVYKHTSEHAKLHNIQKSQIYLSSGWGIVKII